jgi:hypothetical protein
MAPRLVVRAIDFLERPVTFRVPYVFGATETHGAPEVFVRVVIEVEGRRAVGVAAELMSPKWFIKDPAVSHDHTFNELRCALRFARDVYLAHGRAETAFGLHAACHAPQRGICLRHGVTPLAASFGAAEIDKAILDALLRHAGVDVFTGLSRNIVGLDARLTPDLADFDIGAFLAGRQVGQSIFVRHTVWIDDPVESLAMAADAGGCSYFKIKLGGDPEADRARLVAIAAEFDRLQVDYRLTLDANEQYRDRAALAALVEALLHDEALAPVMQRLFYLEQPFARPLTWTVALDDLGRSFAFIIDEADDGYDAFPHALALGYRGVSVKGGKGLYKALLNAARCVRLSNGGKRRVFVTAEDLTCQAGLAVQQDTALAAFLGITHAERNGHNFVDGFACAPPEEARAFRAAHPDLYEDCSGQVRLAIRDGTLSIASLAQPGFACGVKPEQVGWGACAMPPSSSRHFGT